MPRTIRQRAALECTAHIKLSRQACDEVQQVAQQGAGCSASRRGAQEVHHISDALQPSGMYLHQTGKR